MRQLGFQFAPGGIEKMATRQAVETRLLDSMDELDWFPLSRNQIVPAAGDQGGGIKTENSVGEGVSQMVIIEEPSV